MEPYLLVIIWVLSHGICLYLIKKRNLRLTLLWQITCVILGPFAIPLVLMLKRVSHRRLS